MVLTLLLFGAAWGMCLAVSGMYALGLGLGRGGSQPDAILVSLGVAGLAAGNFVFMEVVADRLVTGSGKRFRDATEILTAAAMMLSLGVSAVIWFARTM